MAPIRIGVAFNMQESKFEPDQWDQTFDWVVTRTGLSANDRAVSNCDG